MSKIEALEHRVEALRGNKQLATVTFKDGSSRTMLLPDVIPLLVAPTLETIENVTGEPSGLLALVKAILEEGVTDED